MSDERLEPLTPFARTVVELEQLRPDPTDVPEEKLLARLTETLEFPLSPTALKPEPSHVAAPAKVGMLSKIVVGTALVSLGAAVGAGTVFGWASDSVEALKGRVHALEAETTAVRAQPPPALEPRAIELPTPVAEPSVAMPSPARHKETGRTKASPAPEVDSLNDENVLVERARTALLRGDPDGALVALDRHSEIHPKGRLSEERDALRVQVLVQLHRRTEAVDLASEFRNKYPRSLLTPSVEAALESSP